MLSLPEYLADPCGSASIPYHKAVRIVPPPGMRVLHHRTLPAADTAGWTDTPYFRLLHRLKDIPPATPPLPYRLRTATEADCGALAALLRLCYPGCGVTEAELAAWRQEAAFHSALWVLAEAADGVLAGAALGELGREAREGSLEWVQVHPDHRDQGLGTSLVLALLSALAPLADFATVSGRLENPTAPQAFYRRCGFTGEDVWHVLAAVK